MIMIYKNEYFPQSVPHPGLDLLEKLEELGMGPKEFAVRTGKPEKTISAILKGESSITPDMAVQFENVLKIPAHFWLNRQRSFDEYKAREKREEAINDAADWTRLFPVAAMINQGWLPKVTNIPAKTAALFSFFAVSTKKAWEDYYFGQKLKVAFRISLVHTKEPYAIAAWLRQGEIQASNIIAQDYSEKKFRDSLPELKNIMAKHPDDFFSRIQLICLETGVKVVNTNCLPKAPINGATRWLNETPLIQLSGRHKRNDIFWFSFFHEAGHVLIHGKKDIFLEDVKYSEYDKKKEKEADEFAVSWTLTLEEEKEILLNINLDDEKLIYYSDKFNTHPAIIIGRLQHDNILRHWKGREYFIPIEF